MVMQVCAREQLEYYYVVLLYTTFDYRSLIYLYIDNCIHNSTHGIYVQYHGHLVRTSQELKGFTFSHLHSLMKVAVQSPKCLNSL